MNESINESAWLASGETKSDNESIRVVTVVEMVVYAQLPFEIFKVEGNHPWLGANK